MKSKQLLTFLFLSLFSLSVVAAKKAITFNVMVSDKAKKK
jgi:hypothetical protein